MVVYETLSWFTGCSCSWTTKAPIRISASTKALVRIFMESKRPKQRIEKIREKICFPLYIYGITKTFISPLRQSGECRTTTDNVGGRGNCGRNWGGKNLKGNSAPHKLRGRRILPQIEGKQSDLEGKRCKKGHWDHRKLFGGRQKWGERGPGVEHCLGHISLPLVPHVYHLCTSWAPSLAPFVYHHPTW